MKIIKAIAFYCIFLFIMVGLCMFEAMTGFAKVVFLVLSALGVLGIFIIYSLDEKSKKEFEEITFRKYFN